MTNYSLEVKNSFFQLFYQEKIGNHYAALQRQNDNTDIAITMFWHGIADFYGKIHLVGSNNLSYEKTQVVDSYRHFIDEFFPKEWSCYSSLLYNIFRNGMIHQISPKYAGIKYYPVGEDNLLYEIIDPNNSTNPSIPQLNVRVYGELVYLGFKEFERRVENDSEPKVMENIYNKIISKTDGLKDQKALAKEISLLGKHSFGPCI